MTHSYTNHRGRTYDLESYTPEWSNRFKSEAQIILDIVGPETKIEHVGSTSVPGMLAKSCIDILVLVNDINEVDQYIEALEKMGYEYKKDIVMDGARLFRKYKDNKAWVNTHFFSANHPHIKEMLVVRDYLRVNPKEVQEYSELKKALYEKYPEDYYLYRDNKDKYMKDLTARALAFFVVSS